jgi:hypothetical protein
MAKKDLLKEAQKAGLAPEDASADDYSEAQLEVLLGRGPAWEGSRSSSEPITARDGHTNLSKEDLEARS